VGHVRSSQSERPSIMDDVSFSVREAFLFADISGYHGQPKVRQSKSHFWTHTSRGGAFGRKVWKLWFNNRAMNKLERRLALETTALERKGSDRYSLRQLHPMDLDTRDVRDSKSVRTLSDFY